jgi:hypothetical protein
MKIERGQLVMAIGDFNSRSPVIIIAPCKDAIAGWYYVYDVVEKRRTMCHKHSLTLLRESESGV